MGTVFSFITDFFKTLFTGGLDFTSRSAREIAWKNFDPSAPWSKTNKAWRIDKGLFKGNFGQIVSRFTWELPQTLAGYTASQVYNLFEGIKSVSYHGGATAVESCSGSWGAFALGSYITGENGLSADPDNWLFQHEYGHYLQSQTSGLFYLHRYAIPSLFSAANSSLHNYHAVEQDANIRAYKYFMKHVAGFNVMDEETKTYPNGRWYYYSNPIVKRGYTYRL